MSSSRCSNTFRRTIHDSKTIPSFWEHICYLRNNQIYKNSQHLVQFETHECIAGNYRAYKYQNSANLHPHSLPLHSSNNVLAPCHHDQSSKPLVLVFFQPLLALVFSRRSVLESSQLWLVLASFPLYAKSALESSPSSTPMVLGSSQISRRSVLVFCA